VLAHLIVGRTNRQIARALFISEKTASVHVTNLLRKLGVTNRFAAAAGIRAGSHPERMSTENTQPRREPAMKRMIVAIALLILTPAAPAAAAPNPSPVAPAHTGTACANVLTKNPQAGPGTRSAPPAQENFFAVGAVFCGIS
jgi:Bacterial regulatory proteins, luxR family